MTRLGILLATDGSTDAERAVELVASSFDPADTGTIELLAVVPRVAEPLGHGPDEPPITLMEGEWQRAAQEVVERTSVRLAEAGHARVGMVRWGHPAETIVTRAGEAGTSLVALGTRGLSGWKRRRTGSVSAKVARYAPVSVLVARSDGPVRRVLLGYDASPDADVALEQVATLPWRGSIEVTVCTSYDVPRLALSGATPTLASDLRAAHRDVSRWAREAAEVMASEAAQRLRGQGISAVARVARGVAHEQLGVVAAEMPADLLVVGSRGLSQIQRFFLGSTSATLLAQAPTSVLVTRATGFHDDRSDPRTHPAAARDRRLSGCPERRGLGRTPPRTSGAGRTVSVPSRTSWARPRPSSAPKMLPPSRLVDRWRRSSAINASPDGACRHPGRSHREAQDRRHRAVAGHVDRANA